MYISPYVLYIYLYINLIYRSILYIDPFYLSVYFIHLFWGVMGDSFR